MSKLIEIGRLNYVEPNITEDGYDFPVNLEDLSIYVDLVVTTKSRFESISDDVQYKISWLLNQEDSASFLAGRKMNETDDKTVLTTYYTEITYNEGKNGMIVEGLGMTNINIDYDSWYMPTITINFTDVRGISLFTPNEYEYHNGKEGEVLANGFFKCFMTFPYPEFTLTVKGFYGQPVVYHLNCIDFKSNFNSNTGNFEATAKFIGYNYAFLADIKFDYLKAAPFDTYEGKRYFESQNNTNSLWRVDGQPIPTLVDLEQKIAKAVGVLDELKQDDKKLKRLAELDEESGRANAIISALDSFLRNMEMDSGAEIVQIDGNDQRLYCFKSATLRFYDDNPNQGYYILPDNVREQWIKLCTLIYEYNDKNPKKKLKYLNNIDNQTSTEGDNVAGKVPTRLKLTEMFDGKGAIIAGNIGVNDNIMKLKGYVVNDVVINEGMAKAIYDANAEKSLPPYVFMFDINSIMKDCSDILNGITSERRELKQYVETFIKEQTINLIGFRPTIFNISKIIFTHLDTFIHSVYTCINKVREEGRDRINGFIAEHSDINSVGNNVTIPPFPAFRKKDSTFQDMWVDKWMGDFDTQQPEVELIYGFNRAVEKIKEEDAALQEKLNLNKNVTKYHSVFPIDVSLGRNPFNKKLLNRDYNIGKFAAHVALRALKVCDIAKNNKYVSDLAKVDAFNFYYANTDEKPKLTTILDRLTGENGGGSFAKTHIISYVKHSNDHIATKADKTDRFIYEFDLVGRQTIIQDSGSNYRNSYLVYNGNDILPNNVSDFTGANDSYVRDYVVNGQLSLPEKLDANNRYFFSNNDGFVAEGKGWQETYRNDSRFNILTESNDISKIDEFTNQQIKVDNGTRITNPLTIEDLKQEIPTDTLLSSEIWKTDNESFKDWYKTKQNIFSTEIKLTEYNANSFQDKILSDDEIQDINEKEKNYSLDRLTKDINIATDINDGNLNDKNNIKDYIDGNIYLGTFKVRNGISTLFGSPFYYMQNENPSSQEDITKTKAFIFLQFLDFNIDKLKNYFSINTDYGCRIEKIPYLVALFIGAILWRKKFINANGRDCIRYESEGLTNLKYLKPYPDDETDIANVLLGNNIYGSLRPDIIIKRRGDIWYNGIRVDDLFGDNKIFNLDYSIHNRFLQAFETWALDNSKGFVAIKNAYELTDKDNKAYNSQTFLKMVDGLYEAYKKSNLWWKEYSKNIEDDKFDNRFAVMKFIRDNFGRSFSNYVSFVISEKGRANGAGHSLFLYNKISTKANLLITELYKQSCIVIFTNPYIEKGNTQRIEANRGIYENYISTFVDTLKELLTNANSNREGNPNTQQPNETVSYSDLYNAMYLYLKKLNDAWFTGRGEKEFSLQKKFLDSFVFVDSFYNDISDALIINCEWLLDRMRQNVGDSNLYSFLADLYSQHGCLFLAIPNFINWNEKNAVSQMLDPVDVLHMDREDTNKFVVMYMHEPSKTLNNNKDKSGTYGYSEDGFMIYDPALTDSKNKESLIPVLKETGNSYKIPSIGVAFAKQNQSYFKNIQVGMENPVTTEASLAAMYQIAEKGGNGSETKGSFWGQDLYRVWSNYSYTCEFEMLGCAQLQPLMYFQLLNIPLFRGTYMITRISHNVKPGYMTTKVRGVKMCRYGKPFLTTAFGFFNTILKESAELSGKYTIGEEETTYSQGEVDRGKQHYTNNVVDEIKDTYTDVYNPDTMGEDDTACSCGGDFDGVCPSLKRLFKALQETIRSSYNGEWGICVSSGKRNDSNDSDHNYGRAIDIMITDKNGNKTSNKSKLPIVFDILLQCYSSEIRQLIWECKGSDSSACVAEAPDHLIHVSVNYKAEDGDIPTGKETPKFQVFEAYNAGDTTARGENNLSPTFLYSVAKKFNNDNYTNNDIRQIVISLANEKGPKAILSKYYGGSSDKKEDSGTLMLSNLVKNCTNINAFESTVKDIGNKYGFDPNWLMFWMFSESQLNPQQTGWGTGLIQWTNSSASASGTSTSALAGMTAEEQIKYVDNWFTANGNIAGKIKNITDIKLLGFQPARFMGGEFNSADSVVFPQGTSNWNTLNKAYTGGEKRDITVADIQRHFFNNIRQVAKKNGITENLDTILVGY